MRTPNLFDRTVQVQSSGGGSPGGGSSALAGVVAAADARTIQSLAAQGITVANMVYTLVDPSAAVGDQLIVGGKTYPVVAAPMRYANDGIGMTIYVTPCGVASD